MKTKTFLNALAPRLIAISVGVLALPSAGTLRAAQTSAAEKMLWNREHDYWHYVQLNDLRAYSDLWDENFLGWPSVSVAPVHKNHITDWITSQTSNGLKFQSVGFKPAAIQVTGDVAVACYWITFKWLDKDGNGATHTVRITHAWLRAGKDWRIVGGMSMPESETPPK